MTYEFPYQISLWIMFWLCMFVWFFFYIDKGSFYLPDLLLHDLPQKAKKNHFTSQTYAEKKEYILKTNNQPLHTTMSNRTISILNK